MSYGPFFPRIRPKKTCDPIDYTEQCDARAVHAREGAWYWDQRREGYCCTILPGPLGLPVLLDACPWCFFPLPGVHARRAWDKKEDAKSQTELAEREPKSPPDGTCWDEDGE